MRSRSSWPRASRARTSGCRGSSSLSAPIDAAAAALARGELVVFPTESLYGLGADARSPAAVDRLVAVRGRDPGRPILVLVRDLRMAVTLTTVLAPAVERLAARFWPGPLTLVLPARPGLPAPLTAGTGTIGVRVPGHPTAA
ncbi:MAG: Sua5/YciO/YrdC/YwlC family protein, partial [Candidatus Binatia bacterium]